MNFYRTGKVQGVTADQTLNLNNSSFKHKGIMIPNGSFLTASPSFFITMGDPTTGTPLGITLVTQSNTIGQLPYIFPGVIQSIRPTVTGRIVLLG